jgi:hypothetical protein
MTLQTAGSVLYFIYGSNFTESSVVTIEGIPTSTSYQGPGLLWAIPNLQAPVGPGTYAVTVSNGAGTSNAASTIVYAPPLGPQAFAVVPSYFLYGTGTNAIAIADVDGDGYGDVIVNGPGATVTIFPGQADGTLGTPRTVPAIAGSAIAAGDVTGNGSPDIITLVYPADPSNGDASAFTVLLNDGTGNFLVGPTVSFAGAYPGPVLFADVLGTGRNDLLVAVEDPTVIYLFPNLGAGNFGSPAVLVALGPSRSFAVADFNGDGRPDIAYANQDAVSTHLLINQGNGQFNDVAPSSLQSANGSVVAGDFNGDGLPDLAVASASTLQTFLNQGNLIFSPVLQTTPVAAGSLVVGDFDGDGVLDMAAPGGDVYPHGALILWGDDSGVFAPENIAGPADSRLLREISMVTASPTSSHRTSRDSYPLSWAAKAESFLSRRRSFLNQGTCCK